MKKNIIYIPGYNSSGRFSDFCDSNFSEVNFHGVDYTKKELSFKSITKKIHKFVGKMEDDVAGILISSMGTPSGLEFINDTDFQGKILLSSPVLEPKQAIKNFLRNQGINVGNSNEEIYELLLKLNISINYNEIISDKYSYESNVNILKKYKEKIHLNYSKNDKVISPEYITSLKNQGISLIEHDGRGGHFHQTPKNILKSEINWLIG